MAFLAEDFAQTSKEGEANCLHGWDNAHTVYNDCVSIVVDHVESPFYWSGPGEDWRLQPGLFISEVPAHQTVQVAGNIAITEFSDSNAAEGSEFPTCFTALTLC
ncbi:hypothetical protein I5Q01_15805 [Serratia ureilytica]|uniref:hypothetical protein n=1 Tax=Serratia TaxID=613 RepID=UPI0012AECCF8|nr:MULTISPECIES: hypothetical protein [Serratia]MBH3061832.1 hypothetical protein [Serratia ureilytica]